MMKTCRSWWRNCALEADSEILRIDEMENGLGPLSPNLCRIRELISSLELCHHKSERWIHNILEAIGQGETTKGLGTRPTGQLHSAEGIWQNACGALSAWCAGSSSTSISFSIGTLPAAQLLQGLGERSALKEWQVQRVIDKIRSVIHWPQADDGPTANYEWLLLGGGEYECAYRNDCPARYKEHEEFWLMTVRTIIHDTHHGQETKLSLGLAIDMLWPCHWNFVGNLQIVLDAIGGCLSSEKPFTACGRNITSIPNKERLGAICHTLKAYCGRMEAKHVDQEMNELLGKPAPEKKWLAMSLEKTIRLQLNPSAEMLAASALDGPEWITE